MKKYMPLCLVLSSILSFHLYAEKPHRFVELGLDAGVGLANNLTGIRDIMKKHIFLDLNTLSDSIKDGGISINTDVDAGVFFNVNIGGWGVGISGGVEGGINGNIPKEIFTLITEGNLHQHTFEGDLTVFGSIFADTAVDVHGQFGKLRVGVVPALYIPLIYIPKSTITYNLDSEEKLYASVESDIQVYSPFSLKDPDPFAATQGLGCDISLQGEYALLPFLDLGGTLSHIPLSGAVLNHQMRLYSKKFAIDGSELLQNQTLEIPEFELEQEYTTGSHRVFRPLRFDVYALYRPLLVDFFAIRPNIGFTHVLAGGIPPYFNAGVEFRLNVLRILFFHLGTGYEEAIWRHRLGFALNLRIIELDLEGGLRSQDLDKSFNLQGASVKVGLRLGF